jgi:hypothetical protein
MDYIGQFVGGDGTDFKKLIKIIVPITSGWIHAGLFSVGHICHVLSSRSTILMLGWMALD